MEARRQSSMMWWIFLLNGTETSISNASSCGGVLRCVRYVILKPKTLTHVFALLVVEQTLIDETNTVTVCYVAPPHHWQALEPYNWKVFQQGDPNKISGIAIHNLTAGRQNTMGLICKYYFSVYLHALDGMLTIPTLKYTDVPTETDEYKRKEQGTWIRELKWHRRMFVYDPAWYFNRLVILCALLWLLSLIPGAFSALASTFIVLKSAAVSLIFTFSVAARWMREVELTVDPRMTEAILRSLL